MDQITIVGSTTWGTTLAIINSMEGKDVVLLVRTEKESDMLNKNRENKRFRPLLDKLGVRLTQIRTKIRIYRHYRKNGGVE